MAESVDKVILEDERPQDERDKQREVGPLDSNFPLLKQFRDKAPGSYKHAQSLVSMIDNVCAEVDIDPYNLKMAAMYHDIGKMWSPKYFTENQPPEDNIHDDLDPFISYELITRHVSDTVTILVAQEFPAEVIRIASQHHGTCILSGFFEKAKKLDYKDLDQEQFRYKTSKPDCIESLILMLCDQVEATSRSLYSDQGLEVAPDTFVLNLYNKLHADGQFDDVSVILGKLKKVQTAIIADVSSNFQKRVKYEEDNKLIKEE